MPCVLIFEGWAHPRSRGENWGGASVRLRVLGSSPLTRGKLDRLGDHGLDRGLIPAHAGKTMTAIDARACRGAHPRSRGENDAHHVAGNPPGGSSPLTRGKPGPKALASTRRRLIPAHAGKTGSASRSRFPGWAHPRSRGENPDVVVGEVPCAGSSPLTRGKPVERRGQPRLLRLIPAHAGKTCSPPRRTEGGWAHPRSRGENPLVDRLTAVAGGSSPLTRGKLDRVPIRRDNLGLIPAHAGKTMMLKGCDWPSAAHPRSRGENLEVPAGPGGGEGLIPAHAGKTGRKPPAIHRGRAHPRSRGENPRRDLQRHDNRGSSPLTRGKPCRRRVSRPVGGLIPAHAGKTFPSRFRGIPSRAHPRSRGENVFGYLSGFFSLGSSPLTRGKPRQPSRPPRVDRLIPAHAGKTNQGMPASSVARAHPRSRGENSGMRWIGSPRRGSSPLTRGKPRPGAGRRAGERLIPAHAGKTW